MTKTILEGERQIPVYAECDILVVGGGAAGHSAAVAAARAGNKNVILMERYGYMGGDVTGGYVIMVPRLSFFNKQYVRGLQEEWFTRMANIPGAVLGPTADEIGSTDAAKVNAWKNIWDTFSTGATQPQHLVRSVYFEPNQLKIEMDKMLLEHKDSIHVMCHSWGTRPIMDGDTIKGVIFESKEGRKAVLAKIVIDATGDGDIFRQTGCPYFGLADKLTRCATTALVWRVGGCDWAAFSEWKKVNPQAANALRENFSKICGFRASPLPGPTNDVCWINNWHAERDCATVKDATETEMETRDTMRDALEYLKEVCPVGFRNAFIYDIAPQLGTRCSYRLDGEYVITSNDFAFPKEQEDVIAWHSTICFINDNCPVEIPYRAILPKKTENLLCPGRHISADELGIDYVNLIPQCVGTGQAAGVAAAVAVADGSTAHGVDIKKVQDILARDQDVPLPRNQYTDPSYMQNVIDHEYGLYTDLAKKAREEAGFLGKVRQFASNQGEIEDADPQSLKSKSEEVTMGTVKSAPVVTDDPHS